MKYKAVIFDMDGVIFDSERLVLEGWQEIAAKYGIKGMEEVLPRCLGVNAQATREIFREYYGQDFPYDEYKKEASALFHSRYGNGKLPLKPGVKELLSYLKENGYLVGLASSTRQAIVEQEIRDAGLMPYFDNLVCGDMLKRSKPEPDIYLKACENLDVEPRMAVAVEDSYNGIRSAKRAGMVPVMVPDMVQPDEEMRSLAHKICKDLFEVKNWISETENFDFL
ncbi:MAG: HAD family phosphatase [Lachnospiraceae bacterium]|nr:HAD family phosphatase [Lachnospiraceae bacterium]MCI7190052.1 HAD family phosphatase [Lachnospiraceae bacterium]MDD7627755.1 HAD family phosphatase [Lachnospiraceae bacterium]MDY4117766.1 HAD family phosphatase [Lachnospiraceae bacterium]